ncbi:GNAT family N-acetyltransferase [Cellulomonas humilata]|uniref:GNAT family N-acetyltransferase n=1 Tax=Cellulomonas humilata TaxID=144055 RepID=UPI0031B636CD
MRAARFGAPHFTRAAAMGTRNYLVEGLSGTGKTTVADELTRRGHQVVHGDRELAYQGDPVTGEPTEGGRHENHLWDVDKVRALVADRSEPATFFCGGSRNFPTFIDLFDEVFVLEVDLATLNRRLDERPDDEWGGGKPTERERIVRWHLTGEDVPNSGVSIDATAPIEQVVDEILRRCPDDTESARLVVRFDVDDDALSRLHARAFGQGGSAPVVPWASRLSRHALTWVGAFEGDRPVGFVHACWDGGAHAFLLDAVVDPDRQRRGIGRRLVEALVDEVRSAGCEWLHVDHEPHLEHFYRQCGFAPTSAGVLRLQP